jgi:hypothetical protein
MNQCGQFAIAGSTQLNVVVDLWAIANRGELLLARQDEFDGATNTLCGNSC